MRLNCLFDIVAIHISAFGEASRMNFVYRLECGHEYENVGKAKLKRGRMQCRRCGNRLMKVMRITRKVKRIFRKKQ
jgi:DNA-directed RNA polymerase subunit RPC12/RpoP